MTTPEITDVKEALTTGLTELRLPTVRHCYEETARLAERETLSYERYLLQLVTRECEDRQRKRAAAQYLGMEFADVELRSERCLSLVAEALDVPGLRGRRPDVAVHQHGLQIGGRRPETRRSDLQ